MDIGYVLLKKTECFRIYRDRNQVQNIFVENQSQIPISLDANWQIYPDILLRRHYLLYLGMR